MALTKIDRQKGEELIISEIQDIIKAHYISDSRAKWQSNERYFEGDHVTINDKDAPTNTNVPDNRVPVPYARKISQTTSNYMFAKPVQYNAEDQEYAGKLKEIFQVNNGNKKTGEIGLDMIIHGVGYKLFYTKKVGADIVPAYAIVDGDGIIPVYNYAIEPELLLAIRYYIIGTGKDALIKVEVYYPTKTFYCHGDGTDPSKADLQFDGAIAHGFSDVPLVVYGDKKREVGIFDPIKPIIDGIDKIISMDVNEIDKFALAYLVLKGQKIDQETVDTIEKKRIFELEKEADLQYLIKQIDSEFNGSVRDFLVSEAHKQSGVPDFASKEFAAESGVALLYKLMGLENLASSIQAAFEEGEHNSINLINSIALRDLKPSLWNKFLFWKKNPEKTVKITMDRNLPEDIMHKINIAKGMKELGLSLETILDFIPVIEDTKAEIDRITEEKEANFQRFMNQEAQKTDEPEEPESDDKKVDEAA